MPVIASICYGCRKSYPHEVDAEGWYAQSPKLHSISFSRGPDWSTSTQLCGRCFLRWSGSGEPLCQGTPVSSRIW